LAIFAAGDAPIATGKPDAMSAWISGIATILIIRLPSPFAQRVVLADSPWWGTRRSFLVGNIAVAVFWLAVIGVFISDWWDFTDFCPSDESKNLALRGREWISAASGYFATLAAAGTVYFLCQQNIEQKRQTAFMLGDAPPTVDITRDLEDPEQVVVRLVN
jgi:hypothetical protein